MISRILQLRSARWFIVGSTTFLIDASLFLIALKFTSSPIISNLFSGAVATCFNYLSHYRWSFASNRSHSQSTILYLLFFFIFLFLGTYLISSLIHAGIHPAPAKVLTAAMLAPLSFFLMKFVTFRRIVLHE